MRLANGRPQFQSHWCIFVRTAVDNSSCLCSIKKMSWDVRPSPSAIVVAQTGISSQVFVGALTKTGHCENREIDKFNQKQVKILMFSRNVLS